MASEAPSSLPALSQELIYRILTERILAEIESRVAACDEAMRKSQDYPFVFPQSFKVDGNDDIVKLGSLPKAILSHVIEILEKLPLLSQQMMADAETDKHCEKAHPSRYMPDCCDACHDHGLQSLFHVTRLMIRRHLLQHLEVQR